MLLVHIGNCPRRVREPKAACAERAPSALSALLAIPPHAQENRSAFDASPLKARQPQISKLSCLDGSGRLQYVGTAKSKAPSEALRARLHKRLLISFLRLPSFLWSPPSSFLVPWQHELCTASTYYQLAVCSAQRLRHFLTAQASSQDVLRAHAKLLAYGIPVVRLQREHLQWQAHQSDSDGFAVLPQQSDGLRQGTVRRRPGQLQQRKLPR